LGPHPTPPGAATRRRVLRATAAAGLALPFLGRGARAAVTWTLFSQQTNPAGIVVRGLGRLSELVRERTGGALLINVRTAGLLPIDASQVMESVASGRVELGDDASPATLAPSAAAMRLPLLATTPEEWARVAAVVRPALSGELERRGIVLLSHYRSPLQLFWSRRKATAFGDMARQRMRVQSVEQAEFVRHYNGLHLITSTVEAGEALAADTLQGTFGTAAGVGQMWKAYLKHVYLAGPNYNDAVIAVGRAALDRLPAGLAPVVLAAAAETGAWLERAQDAEEARVLRTLASAGVTVTPANAEDIRQGTARLPTYWDNWVRLRGSDAEALLASIRQTLDR